MQFLARQRGRLGLCMTAAVLLGAVRPAAAETQADYKKLMDEVAPALVTIKYVLKFQGQGGVQEREREFTAVMIEKTGLILCAGVQLGTSKMFQRMGMGSITPTDIKVLIGDDTNGVDAKLLATDAELDLSWIQIKEPAEAGYAHVNLEKSTTPTLGDDLLTLSRLDKFFDRAVVIRQGRLAGQTTKPRDLMVPSGMEMEPGMPVFAADGSPVGVVVVQSPDTEDTARSASTAALLLSARDVAKATIRAKATAEAEEEDEDDEEPATDSTTPTPTTQPASDDE